MARIDMTAANGAEISAVNGAEAYYRLGLMYSAGRDCPVDYVAAHKWFNVALARGFRPAAELRTELAAQMSGDELAEALREARLFLTRH
jgi:TPR repeat protein